MQRERGLARALGPVDLDDPPARQPADAERDIEAERARRDDLGIRSRLARAQLHDRALAERPLDLAERGVEGLLLVHGVLVQQAQSRLRHNLPSLFHRVLALATNPVRSGSVHALFTVASSFFVLFNLAQKPHRERGALVGGGVSGCPANPLGFVRGGVSGCAATAGAAPSGVTSPPGRFPGITSVTLPARCVIERDPSRRWISPPRSSRLWNAFPMHPRTTIAFIVRGSSRTRAINCTQGKRPTHCDAAGAKALLRQLFGRSLSNWCENLCLADGYFATMQARKFRLSFGVKTER